MIIWGGGLYCHHTTGSHLFPIVVGFVSRLLAVFSDSMLSHYNVNVNYSLSCTFFKFCAVLCRAVLSPLIHCDSFEPLQSQCYLMCIHT